MAGAVNWWANCYPCETVQRLASHWAPDPRGLDVMIWCQDGVVIRNLVYQTWADLWTEVRRRQPLRIDLGGYYRHRHLSRKDARGKRGDLASRAIARALVFDIDMPVYREEGILPQCSRCEREACEECWAQVIRPAQRVMQRVLGDELGFRLLWVCSGRKGVHCYALGDGAETLLTRAHREQICALVEGDGPYGDEVFTREFGAAWMRPGKRSPEELAAQICKVNGALAGAVRGKPTTAATWRAAEQALGRERFEAEVRLPLFRRLFRPRLDRAVTVDPAHMLKAPFVVHPDTERVSIPILDPESFRGPADCPRVEDVLRNPSLLRPYARFVDTFLDGGGAPE